MPRPMFPFDPDRMAPDSMPMARGGIFGQSVPQAPPQQVPQMQQPAPWKPSFSDKLSMFGEALQGGNSYRRDLMRQRQEAMQAQQEQEALRRKQFEPREVGGSLVRLNPETMQYEVVLTPPKERAPHFWETNSGSLGMVGDDGKPQIVYPDPDPLWRSVFNPATNQMEMVEVPSAARTGQRPPINSVIPDPRKAGGAGSPPRTFP